MGIPFPVAQEMTFQQLILQDRESRIVDAERDLMRAHIAYCAAAAVAPIKNGAKPYNKLIKALQKDLNG